MALVRGMKPLPKFLAYIVGCLLFVYAIGAFVAASFDINAWSMFQRSVFGVGGALVSVLVAATKSELFDE